MPPRSPDQPGQPNPRERQDRERREFAERMSAFELLLYQAILAALGRWLAAVRAMVLPPPPAADSGGGPGGAQMPTTSGLSQAEAEWTRAIRELVRPVIARLFGEEFQRHARVADLSDLPYQLAHIEQVESRLRLFPSEQFEDIRLEIAEAIDNGESVEQIRDRIGAFLDFDATAGAHGEQAEAREVRGDLDVIERRLDAHERAVPGDGSQLSPAEERALRAERSRLYARLHRLNGRWRWKAERIARTEVHGAMNGGAYAAALAGEQALGETFWKEWLATEDDRTRDSHRAADGQVRLLRDPFGVGGFDLAYPGDPSGPAHEVIQCRCALLILDSAELDDLGIDSADLPDGGRQGSAPGALPASASDPDLAVTPTERPEQGGTMTVTATEPSAGAPEGTAADGEAGRELPDGWRGVLAPLDTRSGDNRIIATPATLRVREAPRSLLWQAALDMGHSGASVVGRIDRVWIQDGMLWGEGPFDLGGDDGPKAARQLGEGYSNGVSVDLDDMTVTEVWYSADGERIPDDLLDDLDWDELEELWEDGARPVMVVTDWRLMTATLVSQPAFDEARVEAVYGYQPTGGSDGRDERDADDEDVSAAGCVRATVVAAAAPAYAAADFQDPQLTGPTPLTVSDDGHVFGHLALWKSCHTSFPDMCVAPPKSTTGYAWFHLGEVITDTGPLPVGKITLGTGHADGKAAARPAAEHYDHTGACVAVVRAGEDEHGIWVAGRLVDGVTDEQVTALRRSPLSGDWRRVNGNLELVAALCVNVPGFPVPRAMAASGETGQQLSLVAAGALPRPRRRSRRRPGGLERPAEPIDYARLARMIVGEQTRVEALQRRADGAARRVGRDARSRMAAAAARIGR